MDEPKIRTIDRWLLPVAIVLAAVILEFGQPAVQWVNHKLYSACAARVLVQNPDIWDLSRVERECR